MAEESALPIFKKRVCFHHAKQSRILVTADERTNVPPPADDIFRSGLRIQRRYAGILYSIRLCPVCPRSVPRYASSKYYNRRSAGQSRAYWCGMLPVHCISRLPAGSDERATTAADGAITSTVADTVVTAGSAIPSAASTSTARADLPGDLLGLARLALVAPPIVAQRPYSRRHRRRRRCLGRRCPSLSPDSATTAYQPRTTSNRSDGTVFGIATAAPSCVHIVCSLRSRAAAAGVQCSWAGRGVTAGCHAAVVLLPHQLLLSPSFNAYMVFAARRHQQLNHLSNCRLARLRSIDRRWS